MILLPFPDRSRGVRSKCAFAVLFPCSFYSLASSPQASSYLPIPAGWEVGCKEDFLETFPADVRLSFFMGERQMPEMAFPPCSQRDSFQSQSRLRYLPSDLNPRNNRSSST